MEPQRDRLKKVRDVAWTIAGVLAVIWFALMVFDIQPAGPQAEASTATPAPTFGPSDLSAAATATSIPTFTPDELVGKQRTYATCIEGIDVWTGWLAADQSQWRHVTSDNFNPYLDARIESYSDPAAYERWGKAWCMYLAYNQ